MGLSFASSIHKRYEAGHERDTASNACPTKRAQRQATALIDGSMGEAARVHLAAQGAALRDSAVDARVNEVLGASSVR